MPPKKNQQPSKKTEQKKKDKIVQDRTFGLKNKNKSKTVQTFIKGVAHQVNSQGQSVSKIQDEQFTSMKQKKREEEEKALLASLFKQVTNVAKDHEGNIIKDKSKIICPYYKQGLCQKGKKCKFSHDLSIFQETEEIDLYVDQRKQLFGEVPEACQQTKIVCNHFLDAVEQGKYGWNWICPNNGMECIYRHCLPMGYELKKDESQMPGDGDPLEDRIEEERCKVASKGTKITLEVFLKWKDEKKNQRKKKEEKKKEDEIKKIQAKSGGSAAIMSGRSLFIFNPNLFVDDDEALGEQDYEERNDNMSEEEEELTKQVIEEAKVIDEEEPWDEKYIAQKISELGQEDNQEAQPQKDLTQTVELQEKQEEIQQQKTKNKKKKKKQQQQQNAVIDDNLFLEEKDYQDGGDQEVKN